MYRRLSLDYFDLTNKLKNMITVRQVLELSYFLGFLQMFIIETEDYFFLQVTLNRKKVFIMSVSVQIQYDFEL